MAGMSAGIGHANANPFGYHPQCFYRDRRIWRKPVCDWRRWRSWCGCCGGKRLQEQERMTSDVLLDIFVSKVIWTLVFFFCELSWRSLFFFRLASSVLLVASLPPFEWNCWHKILIVFIFFAFLSRVRMFIFQLVPSLPIVSFISSTGHPPLLFLMICICLFLWWYYRQLLQSYK